MRVAAGDSELRLYHRDVWLTVLWWTLCCVLVVLVGTLLYYWGWV